MPATVWIAEAKKVLWDVQKTNYESSRKNILALTALCECLIFALEDIVKKPELK